jgi:L-fuculose-phosphate aldolase
MLSIKDRPSRAPAQDRVMTDTAKRQEIISTLLAMTAQGINQGTSGNVSIRDGEGFLITPSGMPYEEMRPDDIVWMDLDGRATGRRKPSSEWRFHRDILRARTDVGAVVHLHAMFCTTLSMLRRDIPAVHYMIAAAGGPTIPCTGYFTYGTQELADAVVQALTNRSACLMANHGMICVGADLRRAAWLALEVETLAAQYWRALQVGTPHVLPDDEIARVKDMFASYGLNAQPADDPAHE